MDPKKILTNKSFCPLPWTGFQLDPTGNVRNCIIAKEFIGNIHKNTIEEILQSPKNLEIKEAMLKDEKPYSCSGCHLQEKHRKNDFESISSRLYYLKNLSPFIDLNLYDDINNFSLHHVDLRWTNACNQACTYCGPTASSKWAIELGKKVKSDKSRRQLVKNFVFSNIKKLKNVYLAGGEPMLMKENKEFLELLYKENKDVDIRVNTNLSTTDTGVFELLCKFKNVHWTVSIETIKEQYNYVRYHGKWEDFLKNLDIIKNLKSHKISFNMLYFVLNAFDIFETIEFFQKKGFHNNSFIIGPLYDPLPLNILNLPARSIEKIRNNLQNKINENPGWLLQNSYENILAYLDTPFDSNIELTKRFFLEMDKRRGTDSRKVFPKLYSEISN